jgi:hypothetical protein
VHLTLYKKAVASGVSFDETDFFPNLIPYLTPHENYYHI